MRPTFDHRSPRPKQVSCWFLSYSSNSPPPRAERTLIGDIQTETEGEFRRALEFLLTEKRDELPEEKLNGLKTNGIGTVLAHNQADSDAEIILSSLESWATFESLCVCLHVNDSRGKRKWMKSNDRTCSIINLYNARSLVIHVSGILYRMCAV